MTNETAMQEWIIITLVFASMFAPADRSSRITSARPLLAVLMRDVSPSYKIEKERVTTIANGNTTRSHRIQIRNKIIIKGQLVFTWSYKWYISVYYVIAIMINWMLWLINIVVTCTLWYLKLSKKSIKFVKIILILNFNIEKSKFPFPFVDWARIS